MREFCFVLGSTKLRGPIAVPFSMCMCMVGGGYAQQVAGSSCVGSSCVLSTRIFLGWVSSCRDEGPSTTLNEAFSDFEEAAYDGMAEQVLSSLGKEEGAPEGSASMDEAFDTNS